jgi:hypothetical protein
VVWRGDGCATMPPRTVCVREKRGREREDANRWVPHGKNNSIQNTTRNMTFLFVTM